MVEIDAYEDAERAVADEQSVSLDEQARTIALARAIGKGVGVTELPILHRTMINAQRQGRVIE